jgi:SAM-dependent methyltransferase
VPAAEPALLTTFALWRCQSCGSAVTLGTADEKGDPHETGAYRPGPPRLYRPSLPLLRAFDRQRLAILADSVPPPARVLDAGAGKGRFVAAAAAAGYAAIGIEPSARGADAAAALGSDVRRVAIESAELPSGSFDAVTLWHVLEHLDDPAGALRRIRSWLRPRGTLLVGVPNLASLQARLGGPRWYHLDVPRHRVHFTPTGLRALLRANGFETGPEHHVLIEHNPFGMWQSLVNRLTRNQSYLYNLLKRNVALDPVDLAVTFGALPLVPVAAALELIAGLSGRGGTIAMPAQRAE